MRKPDFFIVGAPKCGTTAMNDYLARHPDIFMATKELHYFGADLQLRNRISEKDYLQYFQSAGNQKISGEASVWYLFSKTAAKEIKAFSPEAKILIMLRDPVDVIYSLHSQNLYDANEDVTDFEKALSLDEERKKGIHLPRSIDFFQLPGYKESALFSEQVKRYLDVFGKDNVHIVLYDDFVANTETTVQQVLAFLNVDASIRTEYNLINPNKKIRYFYLHRLIKQPPSALVKMVRAFLPVRNLRHAIMSFLLNRNIEIKKREKMKEDIRSSLEVFFADDIQKLSKLINRDLSAWLR